VPACTGFPWRWGGLRRCRRRRCAAGGLGAGDGLGVVAVVHEAAQPLDEAVVVHLREEGARGLLPGAEHGQDDAEAVHVALGRELERLVVLGRDVPERGCARRAWPWKSAMRGSMSSSSRTLAGFRSRWMIGGWCRYSSPAATQATAAGCRSSCTRRRGSGSRVAARAPPAGAGCGGGCT
jgi:hypothetical protein